MPTALEFLRCILPDEGYKCATVIGERKFNKFFTSVDELAAFISTQDALGHTVYHACSSFSTNENRTQPNVCAIQAFWLDLDAGEGKPYVDQHEAYRALAGFCSRTGLPAPLLVGSGYGLHAYWPLVESLEPARWKLLAIQLQLLCQREGLHVDPARTRDSSSILRTPGTHNRKHAAERVVTCGEIEGPYDVSELGELNAGAGQAVVRLRFEQPKQLLELRSSEVRQASAWMLARPRGLTDAAGAVYSERPVNIELVADQCRQVGALRETNGVLPEPIWYAALGVLAFADADNTAHEWSSGYPGYSHAETQGRLDRQRQNSGPVTCAHFSSINPGPCGACPHRGKIGSPLQLGRTAIESSTVQHGPSTRLSEEGGPDVKVPQDFVLRQNGLFFKTSKGDQNVETLISASPIWLDSVQTGEITQEQFSLCFKLQLPHGGERDVTLDAKTFFSSHGISEMHGRGAVIHDSDLFRNYVRQSMDMWHQENKLEMRYDQFGWKDEERAFLFGNNLYSASGVERVIESDELRTRSQYLGSGSGSLERWSRAANSLFTKGCEPQSFALLASFAAPLMRFHSAGEGGAIVSLVSDQSGSGKTTALEAVASVWGKLKGIQLTDDDTKVAKGLTLGVLGNLPCTFDELYNRDPEMIRQFVLMFTNGRDKARGTTEGKLRHSKAEWQTILVLASNNSITDILSSMDGTDAPAFRILEFVTEFPQTVEKKGDELKRELMANSGWAGDAYLRALLQPETLAYVKQALPKWTDSIWKRTGLRSEHRFWVRTLASVVAAGVLVRHLGVLDFSVQRILDWSCEQLQAKANDATVTGVRDNVSALSEFFNAHIQDMLVMPKAWTPHSSIKPRIEPRRELLIRYELQEGRAYILEKTLRTWLVKKGVNRSAFMADLKGRRVLGEARRVTLGAGTDYASGQVTTIEVNMNHPALSGVAIDVENIVREGSTREQRIAEFPQRSSSSAPPSQSPPKA